MQEHARRTRRRRTLRRLALGFAIAAGAVFVGFAALLVLLGTERTATWTAGRLLARVRVIPGAALQLDGLRALPSGVVDIRNPRLTDGDSVRVAGAAHIRLRVNWGALWHRSVVVDTLWVDGPALDVRALQRGLARRPPAPPAEESKPTEGSEFFALTVAHALLIHGTLQAPLALQGGAAMVTAGDLEARIRDFRLGRTVSAQLDSLGARIEVGPRTAVLTVRGALVDGDARLDGLELATPVSRVTVNGTAPCFGGLDSLLANLTLTLTARPLDGADVRPFLAAADSAGARDITVRVNLQGPALTRTTGMVAVDVADLVWGVQRIPEAHLSAAFTDGAAALACNVRADGRGLALHGTARPFDAEIPFDLALAVDRAQLVLAGRCSPRGGPDYTVTSGRFSNLDLAGLTQGAPATDLEGRFTLEGRGFSPRTMNAAADLDLAPSRAGAYEIDSVQAHVALQAGRLEITARLRGNGATATLAARAQPFAAPPALDSAAVRFAHFDVTRWLTNARPPTDLNGTLTVSGRDGDAAAGAGAPAGAGIRRASALLELEPSQVGTQALRSGALRIGLAGERVTLRGALHFPEGGLDLAGTAEPFAAVPRYELHDLRFTSLDVGAILADPELQMRLNGGAKFSGQGRTADALACDATFDLAPSTVRGAVVDSAHVAASYDRGAVQLSGTAHVPGGDGDVEAAGMLRGADPRYQARGSFRTSDLARLLRRPLPEAGGEFHFAAAGEGLNADAMRVAGTLTGRARYGSLQVDSLAAAARFEHGKLHVDSLLVQSNVARLAGGGTMRLPAALPALGESLQVVGVVTDATPLGSLLGHRLVRLGRGDVRASLRGTGTGADFAADLGAQHLRVDSLTVAALSLRAGGAVSASRHLESARGEMTIDTLRTARLELRRTAATAAFDGHELGVQLSAVADDTTRLRLVARGEPRPAGKAMLDTLDVALGGDAWHLTHPVAVTYGRRVSVGDLLLTAGARRIAVDGALDQDGEHDITARVDALRLQSFAGFLGWPKLFGTLDGELQVRGPAAAPHAEGRAVVEVTEAGTRRLAIEAAFANEPGGVGLHTRITNAGGDSLTIAGRLPVVVPGLHMAPLDTTAAMDLQVHGDGFVIDGLGSGLPRGTVEGLAGTLRLNAAVTGTFRQPRLEGEVQLENGAFRLPASGVTYGNVRLAAHLAPGRLQLENLAMTTKKGTLQATGDLRAGAAGWDSLQLHAKLDRFVAVSNRQMHVEATGTVDASGTLTAPVLASALVLTDTDINLSDTPAGAAEAVQLTAADLQMLEEHFGYRPPAASKSAPPVFDATSITATVEAGSDTWARRRRSPRVAIEVKGKVDVRKEPHAPLQVFGRLEGGTQRSYVEQMGRRFELVNGTVVLNGDPLQSVVDFKAKYEVPSSSGSNTPDATIYLAANGAADQLHVALTADPAMDETQILSYLATGRPPQGTTATESTTSAGTAIAIGQASAAMEELGTSVGLDVAQVRSEGTRGTTLVAGNYVNPRTYLGMRQSATLQTQENQASSTGATTEVELEYEFLNWLFVNVQGGVNDVRIMFRSRYAY